MTTTRLLLPAHKSSTARYPISLATTRSRRDGEPDVYKRQDEFGVTIGEDQELKTVGDLLKIIEEAEAE